jgi:hypothetical protein
LLEFQDVENQNIGPIKDQREKKREAAEVPILPTLAGVFKERKVENIHIPLRVEFPCLNLHPFMTQNRSLTTSGLTIRELSLYTVNAVDRVDE